MHFVTFTHTQAEVMSSLTASGAGWTAMLMFHCLGLYLIPADQHFSLIWSQDDSPEIALHSSSLGSSLLA